MPDSQKTDTYEVLLGELVGDLGVVHDEIKNLPGNWNKAVKETCDQASQELTSLGNTNISRIQQSAIQQREMLRNAVNAAVEKPINEAAKAMRTSAQVHRQYIEDQRARSLFGLISFFVAGCIGGSVGGVLTLYVIGKLA